MKKNPKSHVKKIADFLGYEDLTEATIDTIAGKSTVKEMSKMFTDRMKKNPLWNSNRSSFIRKGEVGDWINYFSKEQSDFIDGQCKEYMEQLGIHFEYKI